MFTFCKTLYNTIQKAQAQKHLHNSFSLHGSDNNTRQLELHDIPESIRSEIMSTTSHYLPAQVLQPSKIANKVMHNVRVIPESGTRIDIFFLTGQHCVQNINHTFTSQVIELYVRVIEKLALTRRVNVQIAILPTIYKKEINMDVAVTIEPQHVNTGVTIKGMSPLIIVYRYEELFKVLLHELLHLYNFDYYEYSQVQNEYKDQFKQDYNINSNHLAINESFNDALTLCIYLGFFIALKRPNEMESLDTFRLAFKAHFTHLKAYLLKQSAKLDLYSKKHFQGVLHESTHVFAYYHAKAALFANSRKMFSFFNYNKMHVSQDMDTIRKFINLVNKSLKRKVYKQLINVYKEQVPASSQFFLRTLRMCNFDLSEKSDNLK